MQTRLTMQKCMPCLPCKLFRPCKPYFMLEQLFGSKTRYKLLKYLVRTQDKPFYVRELSRALDTQLNAIRRELELLIKLGLVKEEHGKHAKSAEYGAALRKYYLVDRDSILYPELKALLAKVQLLGEEALIKDIKEKAGKIKLFILTGHFTNDIHSPSDILLVGDLKERTLLKIFADYEKELGFSIRYTLMSEAEFKDRRQMMDKFLFALFETENVKVINELKV